MKCTYIENRKRIGNVCKLSFAAGHDYRGTNRISRSRVPQRTHLVTGDSVTLFIRNKSITVYY